MVSYRASAIALLSSCFAFASEENRRFSEVGQLIDAVRRYIKTDACVSSTDGNGCDVGQTYGWPMNTWDVSNITDMKTLFSGCEFWHHCDSDYRSFDEDISDWNVSQVTDMGFMFNGATSFNGDLSLWDTSKVTDMGWMFNYATSFNGDLSKWNVSQVMGMGLMFEGASSFNSDLALWDVSQVRYMGFMFSGATSFNGNLSLWDTSKVEIMSGMFAGATSFNGDLSLWDVSKGYAGWMFEGATSFNQDLCVWQDKFTYQSGWMNVFSNTGCMFQDDPNEQEGGPFCASSCNDGVATVTLINAVTVFAATLIFVQNML